jgi:hypothetical protein
VCPGYGDFGYYDSFGRKTYINKSVEINLTYSKNVFSRLNVAYNFTIGFQKNYFTTDYLNIGHVISIKYTPKIQFRKIIRSLSNSFFVFGCYGLGTRYNTPGLQHPYARFSSITAGFGLQWHPPKLFKWKNEHWSLLFQNSYPVIWFKNMGPIGLGVLGITYKIVNKRE